MVSKLKYLVISNDQYFLPNYHHAIQTAEGIEKIIYLMATRCRVNT